jgi:hypothetical protein
MTPHQVVARCISAGCAAWLARLGFKRKGLVFRRTVAGVHDFAYFQVDRWLSPQPAFVLELGSRHPEVHRMLGHRALPETSFMSTVRTRLGPPTDEVDPWWQVRPGREEFVGAQLLEDLRERLPEWFALAHDLPAMDLLLSRPEPPFFCDSLLAPAAIAIVSGHSERGKARLDDVVERVELERRHRAEEFARVDNYGIAVLAEARHVLTKL